MTQNTSLWTRIKNFVSPPRESYDTRQARPDGDIHSLPEQHNQATDYRRHGGSMEIGSH